MRSAIRVSVLGATMLFALGLIPAYATGVSEKSDPRAVAEAVRQVIARKAKSVQLVTFPQTPWSAVKIVRGSGAANPQNARTMAEKPEVSEIVMFGEGQHNAVRVMRGETEPTARPAVPPHPLNGTIAETVSFADPADRSVTVIRGAGWRMPDAELFGPASIAELDRVAFSVDGAESSHGADLRMWRPEPTGPQGPMQVTAAAAIDAGGGDRFDLAGNRMLGRAYLARMYRRYGNWADAIAAYNWGPGNVDAWISGGRAADKLPLGVERYRDRVLRDAVPLGRTP